MESDAPRDVGRDVDFGFALPFASGTETSIAMNGNGVLLEIHRADNGDALVYRVGATHQADIRWGPERPYDSGASPRCALNGSGGVIAVHQGSTLIYRIGQVRDQTVAWGSRVSYDTGNAPAVALNDTGIVVEVHQTRTDSRLQYRIGQIQGDALRFGPNTPLDKGVTPSIALNNSFMVVLTYRSPNDHRLWYRLGRVHSDRISWGARALYGFGIAPSIALADDGGVIEAHQTRKAGALRSRVGQIRGESIIWSGTGDTYEDGRRPSVAVSPDGRHAIQTHRSPDSATLRYSSSLWIDRAFWMENALPVIGEKSLRQIAIPGSHDAGMYESRFPQILARTQDRDICDQLKHGVRYFDLRPRWTGSDLLVVHGPITGRPIRELLQDAGRFLRDGHRELIVLKFSHYDNFDSAGKAYGKLVEDIEEALGPWLYTSPPPGKRLADIPLRDLLQTRGQALIVCDGDHPRHAPTPGIWVYRDWNAHDPQYGDLRVFDQYANTTDCAAMMEDQIGKFDAYSGTCRNAPNIPCDLFLLSWTLTPVTDVWNVSKPANRILGKAMSDLPIPNPFGHTINIVYTDYVERSRATDICLYWNGIASGSGTYGPSHSFLCCSDI